MMCKIFKEKMHTSKCENRLAFDKKRSSCSENQKKLSGENRCASEIINGANQLLLKLLIPLFCSKIILNAF